MHKDYNFIVKLTTCCPGNCRCCTNRQENFKYKNENNKQFDLNVFDKICNNIKKLGGTYICLSGGEPSIIKNLNDYILTAKKYGLSTRLNTNGFNVDEHNLENWLKSGLDQIVLSIYSLNRDTFFKMRGNYLMYERALSAVDTIYKLKERYKFVFIIQTIITKDNYKEMPELLDYSIRNKINIFWPSYLEDAINLPDIRMDKNDIIDFKKNIIPILKNIIMSNITDIAIRKRAILSVDKIYNDGTYNNLYHERNETCQWSGKHFTFYPNGTIDPCPGHEYFKSNYQFKIDYKDIDRFMTFENLKKYSNKCFEYCKYCPQGKHHDISFVPEFFYEHDSKERLQ